jgi:hypothetical protein
MANVFSQRWGESRDGADRRATAEHVEVRRASATSIDADQPAGTIGASSLDADVRRARALANWMDARFSILGVRVGLDSVIGLVPVVGDTLTAAVGLYPLWVAHKHGLGTAVKVRMGLNVLADWAVGLVPVAGDLLDVAFKANLRNADLLERAAEAARAAGR